MKRKFFVRADEFKHVCDMQDEARTRPIIMTTYPLYGDDLCIEVEEASK